MSEVHLVCATCPNDAYPAPEIDGVPVISVETLTKVQTSTGSHVMAMCPTCCDQLAERMVVINETPGPGEIPVP